MFVETHGFGVHDVAVDVEFVEAAEAGAVRLTVFLVWFVLLAASVAHAGVPRRAVVARVARRFDARELWPLRHILRCGSVWQVIRVESRREVDSRLNFTTWANPSVHLTSPALLRCRPSLGPDPSEPPGLTAAVLATEDGLVLGREGHDPSVIVVFDLLIFVRGFERVHFSVPRMPL